MIQRQSDSFSRFAHSFTLLSTSFFFLLCLSSSFFPSLDVAPAPAASSARQRAEKAGWRRRKGEVRVEEDDEKSHNPLERRSLDSRVRVYRKGSQANARRVKASPYVRKLKS